MEQKETRAEWTQSLSVAQAIRLAECELANLKTWLAADPNTPHSIETGYRLQELALVLIARGGY